MSKLKQYYEFLKHKLKNDFTIVSDFLTTDLHVINDSIVELGGYVVRDGGMEYTDEKTGKKITRYKDGENLKEAYLPLKTVPAYGGVQDAHLQQDDRYIGHWDKFKYIPKGTPGVYAKEDVAPHDPEYDKKMDIDRKYNRVWSRLNLDDERIKHLGIDKKDLKNLPVSASYQDLGYGEKQKVGEVFHIAVSFGDEKDRCSTLNGTSCNVSLIGDLINNQIEKGVIVQDFDDLCKNKNLNKKEKNTMSKKDKNKEIEEDTDDIEDAMKTSTSETREPMKGGEKKYPGGEIDGDDDRAEEKIEGAPGQEKVKKKKMDLIPLDAVKDLISEAVKTAVEPYQKTLEAITKRNEDLVEKEAQELREDLMKEPFGYSEDYLKDKNLSKLKELKEDFKQTKVYKDFMESKTETDFGSIDKNILGSKIAPKNVLQDFISNSNKEHWGWNENPKDFFTDPHGGDN